MHACVGDTLTLDIIGEPHNLVEVLNGELWAPQYGLRPQPMTDAPLVAQHSCMRAMNWLSCSHVCRRSAAEFSTHSPHGGHGEPSRTALSQLAARLMPVPIVPRPQLCDAQSP